jgi:hemolysin activation/secretion protein
LDSIILAGNLKLRKSFLYGYLGLKRHKPYNESVMQAIPLRMEELEFANLTQPPGISFSEKEAALYIYANKQKTNQFDGYLGVVPNDEVSGKVLLTGKLTLNLNNALTLGENLRFNWQRIQVLSQNLNIYADFPYLFYSSFGVDGEFMLEKRDTSYINLNISVGIRYYLRQKNYIRAYYQFNNARLINNATLEYLTFLPADIDYHSHLYGLEIVFHKLDYLFNPRKGYAFSFGTAIGQRVIIKNNNITDSLYKDVNLSSMQIRLSGKMDVYFPIKNRWVWYIALKGGHIQAYQLFENEIFRIGGLKTIRGFDEQSIYASTYGVLNNELRFIFSKKSYIQLFFDLAWYECKLSRGYVSDIPFGFGAGISFDTKAGIFSFNYALGKQLNNPIRFNAGKITFGYTALF